MNKLLKQLFDGRCRPALGRQAQAMPITETLASRCYHIYQLLAKPQVTSGLPSGTTSLEASVPIGSAVTLATWILIHQPQPRPLECWRLHVDLATATIDVQNSGLLSITGAGTLTGVDSTDPGTWPSARSQQVELAS
ncbi:MAG: hypothetical protein Udaeo2_26270 [Candidatus Udaeobacter sp.]|nr:MAG: hypothetical protein Udaeo2_26270 [Candidatus Udaeobacter sp.]